MPSVIIRHMTLNFLVCILPLNTLSTFYWTNPSLFTPIINPLRVVSTNLQKNTLLSKSDNFRTYHSLTALCNIFQVLKMLPPTAYLDWLSITSLNKMTCLFLPLKLLLHSSLILTHMFFNFLNAQTLFSTKLLFPIQFILFL